MKRINSLNELKLLASNRVDWYADCFIALNGGARSSKQVHFDNETEIFDIINEIDGSFEELTEDELKLNTNIYLAIQQGAFYQY